MIREAKKAEELDDDLSFRTMLLLAIATSIDALAVGVHRELVRVERRAALEGAAAPDDLEDGLGGRGSALVRFGELSDEEERGCAHDDALALDLDGGDDGKFHGVPPTSFRTTRGRGHPRTRACRRRRAGR